MPGNSMADMGIVRPAGYTIPADDVTPYSNTSQAPNPAVNPVGNTGPADIDDSPRPAFRQSPNEGISIKIINHSITIKILF